MDNDLLKELETEFENIKKELKFKSSFQDIEEIFFLKDLVQKEGYVTTSLSRLICHRIVNTFMSWTNYLHGLVMPNPSYMISTTESQIFDEEGKREIITLMTKTMAITSKNSLLGLTKNKLEEGKFIDDAVYFWQNTFSKELTQIFTKVNSYWEEKAKEKVGLIKKQEAK